MGVLAKKGIFNGRKVPLSGVGSALPHSAALDVASRSCFDSLGLEIIADKILLSEALSPKDADLLWKNASLPVLMKLVALKYKTLPPVNFVPVLYLSMDELFKNYSGGQLRKKLCSQIRSYGYYNLRIWLSLRGFNALPLSLDELVQAVKSEFPNVKFIAPSCSRIIAELATTQNLSSGSDIQRPVRQVIDRLARAGIYRLGESGCKEALAVCHEHQMPNYIVSRVTHLDTAKFIKEVALLRALNQTDSVVTSWSPGVEDFVSTNPSREYLVLKALGIGSLLLDNVPQRRANSRAISVGALSLCPLLGANAYIHAAIDSRTATALNIHTVDQLIEHFELHQ